ncbi:LytR/AlgR family response regulator transcription factor [Xanthocytophaga flava]|uniref:LytR/AlgR family response regulator transcription factor n=1 Tax=Xanthocytophaga flava TaxID=3048013 RepID=UPI0028D509B1|nr:LytTR family DNA-binding domain-containing protein [Xanthocytophaga flavus]MDJ1473829.1 LytTR family DNA-binding domain-containing protein [Xanthocytophaga flavus]
MKIRCLLVDDEPIARQILERYCALLPEMEVVASCSNALEAKRVIQSRTIDLIFLDINMPVLDGLSFMKTLTKPPMVIFTTAYKEFAHEAFDLAACDYLLKPFSLERFIVAVDKVQEKWGVREKVGEEVATESYSFLKSEGKIYKINFNEVYFAEADGNNVKIVTNDSVIRPVITLTTLEDILPKPIFIRLHRSFIINKDKITHIEGNRVFMNAIEIPIGANYREHFFRELGIR